MTFNTLRNDTHTEAQRKTYGGLMNEFSRFEVQLIAKINDVPFEWGVTSKPIIIAMLQERNLPIPNAETMERYKEIHRNGYKELEEAPAAPKAVAAKKPAAPKPKPVAQAKTPAAPKNYYETLDRKALIKEGVAKGIKKATIMKSKDIVAALNAPGE